MKKVLVLGATGSLGRVAVDRFLETTDAQLTLFVRNRRRLGRPKSPRIRVIEGDVLNEAQLQSAVRGHDVVYANLAGDLEAMTHNIVRAMKAAGVKRLIFISSMGIYGEVPGERYHSVLDPYRKGAEVVEASGLDYTVLRPGWFTDDDEIDYEVTQKGEPFRGHDVSRKSLAELIVKLALDDKLELRHSIGVNKPV